MFGVVQYREPPADLPGMADVATDSVGQLRRFTGVPSPGQQQPLALENWSLAFADAGLDFGTFKRVDTSPTLPVANDHTAVWEGVDPDKPSERLRVTAASFKGIPVFFEVGSTATPASESSRGWWWTETVPQLLIVAVTFAGLVGAVVLARRNIRQGQWDRSGALKVAAYFFGVAIVAGVLRADHLPVATAEIMLVMKVVAWNLSLAGFLFLMYVAFEPSVRRRWPHVLTAWARVLTGRVRDPLVGRDILIGALAGITIALLREAEFLIAEWLQLSLPAPFVSSMDGLGSWQQFASLALFVPLESVYVASSWLLILLLLRMLLRRNALAVIAAIAVAAPTAMLSSESPLLATGLGVLVATIVMVVLMQCGLLALVIAITVANAITRLPMTLDSSQWYAGRSWIVMLCLLGLIVHGFRSQWSDTLSRTARAS
jgi:serine/threonine-protein kinase